SLSGGEKPSLEFVKEQRVLFEANSAVRYLLNEVTITSTTDADLIAYLQRNSIIEREEAVLRPLVAAGKTEKALAVAEAIVAGEHNKAVIGNFEKPHATDVIIFATLYHTIKNTSVDESKYPKLVVWFKRLCQVHCVARGISAAKARTSGLADANPSPLATLDPATQKVKASAILNLDPTRKKLPIKSERNILITSALPYVNNIPHLGNIIGSVLSADVYARFCRARGYNTLYICGTDEYGTATETKALEEGVSCQELCDKYNAIHSQVYEWFGISFDHFGRTTTRQQTEIAQDIFLNLHKNGLLAEDTMVQLYCKQCSRFLADRYVEGTCPHCKYDDARGDQCDKCGHLLNAIELINPRCKLDGNQPITKESKHMFLDLTTLQPKIEQFTEESASKGKWSLNGITITQSWLKEGLKPRCITRDLKWGTPVPLEEMKDKVFYVWFDAPIGYLSISANYTEEWEKWWKNPEDVRLYQFMGKDNVPFHTVIFPGSLIGTGENWTLLHHVSTTEYLNYEGGKFSKSRNIGVFGSNVMESGIPVEVWRYYLIASRPETNDSVFTWKEFIAKNNGELLNNVGNFVNRVIKFIGAKYDSVIPQFDLEEETEKTLVKDVNALLQQYIEALEAVKIRAALNAAMAISQRGNQYLQDSKIDNTLFTNNRKRCDTVVGVTTNLIYLISALFYPYMPSTTDSILRQLNAPLRTIPDAWSLDIDPGHRIGQAEYLFTKIDEKLEAVFKGKYGGNSAQAIPATDAATAVTSSATSTVGKKSSKKPSAPAAPVWSGPKPDELVALEKKVEEQGMVVRKLKAEGADKAKLQEELNSLLAIKKEVADLMERLTAEKN
ncbi:tRNA synthetases class I (M)-domain-containing protein, partial [Jimgerdemannia flammicorona]